MTKIDFNELLDIPTLGARLQEFADRIIPQLVETSGTDERVIAQEIEADPWKLLVWYAEA